MHSVGHRQVGVDVAAPYRHAADHTPVAQTAHAGREQVPALPHTELRKLDTPVSSTTGVSRKPHTEEPRPRLSTQCQAVEGRLDSTLRSTQSMPWTPVDVKPYIPVAQPVWSGHDGVYPLEAVAAVTGMTPSFVGKVVGKSKSATLCPMTSDCCWSRTPTTRPSFHARAYWTTSKRSPTARR